MVIIVCNVITFTADYQKVLIKTHTAFTKPYKMNIIAPNLKRITVKCMKLALIPQIFPVLEIINKHCSQV